MGRPVETGVDVAWQSTVRLCPDWFHRQSPGDCRSQAQEGTPGVCSGEAPWARKQGRN